MSYDDRGCPSSRGSYLEVVCLLAVAGPLLIYRVLKWVGLRRSLAMVVLASQIPWRSAFVSPGLVDVLLLLMLTGVVLSWFYRHKKLMDDH